MNQGVAEVGSGRQAGLAWRVGLLLLPLGLALGAGLALSGPVPQPVDYHDFADQRGWLGVPHLQNVASNLPFVAVGALGLAWLARNARDRRQTAFRTAAERLPYGLFFAGILLTGLGSLYYHLEPTNERLFWDRLPIALAFMALFAAVLGERLGRRVGQALLGPLLVLGAASVVLWLLSERRGAGDLRAYLLVQGYPLVVIPLLLVLFPARYTRGAGFVAALGWYLLAKGAEVGDARIYEWTGHLVSGHVLKHLFSALGAYAILGMLQRRRPVAVPASAEGPALAG